MGIRLPSLIANVRQFHRLQSAASRNHHHFNQPDVVPKGHFAVYVGDKDQQEKKRFVLPIAYLNHPTFQDLLRKAEEEFGYDHPTGGLTIPCNEVAFVDIMASRLHLQL
ncbi:OLC1v1003397C1 [Oldenlandia corymbosa var. corymbosa]|uniref:OLC1v1003397C1 n=1 Tax=Oldenlandia corymbosa var. corymbosa TaxID=529605 RepID=A0AAV1D9Y3_OLDCO|nr:OLC1v1003397C1 [Oldenlandia corymbosa var. corymbosa]